MTETRTRKNQALYTDPVDRKSRENKFNLHDSAMLSTRHGCHGRVIKGMGVTLLLIFSYICDAFVSYDIAQPNGQHQSTLCKIKTKKLLTSTAVPKLKSALVRLCCRGPPGPSCSTEAAGRAICCDLLQIALAGGPGGCGGRHHGEEWADSER